MNASAARPLRLAINGYGRIGRAVLRALMERPSDAAVLEIVAINEPADLASIAHLTRFDSTHGRFPGEVAVDGEQLRVQGRALRVTHERAPEAVDWSGVDVVVECSGQYGRRDELARFLAAGAPRVLVSQPAASAADVDATILPGVNLHTLPPDAQIVSAGSCTTNASVPVLAALDAAFGIEHVLLNTIHSVMNDQPLIDGYHARDLRCQRSAMQSIIPVETGLARGVVRLLPQLHGRVQARALRVPVVNVSAIEMTLQCRHALDVARLHDCLRRAAAAVPDLLSLSETPCVSVDFNHEAHSAIVDLAQTRVAGAHLASLLVWFDNEWGFANRMLDVLAHWHSLRH